MPNELVNKLTAYDLKTYLEGEGFIFKGDMAQCPFHEDKEPSFHVSQKNGTWVYFCHGCGAKGNVISYYAEKHNCENARAVRELAIKFGFEDETKKKTQDWEIERFHVYRNEKGEPVFRKVKYKNGDWKFQRWEDGEWKFGKGDRAHIPFNLDKFGKAKHAMILEGEKDCESIGTLMPIVTTTAPTGKGAWPAEITKYFISFEGILFLYDRGAENDSRRHAGILADAYPEMKISIAELPDSLKENEDITDLLNQIPDKKDKLKALQEIIAKAKPLPRKGPAFVTARDMTEKRKIITWVWPDRIPEGMLSLICGDAGVGKSLLACDIASHISSGKKWPGLPFGPEPGEVIIISSEDIFNVILEPRLAAAGANLERIILCGYSIDDKGEKENIDLTRHIKYIERKIRHLFKQGANPRLLILDPISALLGPRMDDNRAIEVRSTMTPLVRMAEDMGIALILIHHLSKDQTKAALHRPAGSHAWVALGRAVWILAKDKDDAEENPENALRVFAPLKLNIAKDPGAVTFRINQSIIQDASGQNMPVPVIDWQPGERYDYDSDELLGPRFMEARLGPEPHAQKEAIAFLNNLFASKDEIPAVEVFEAAEENDINESTLKRAKKKLGLQSEKRKNSSGDEFWVWRKLQKQGGQDGLRRI